MRLSVLVLAVLVLAGCGAGTDRPAASPPYTDTATGRCLESEGYAVAYEHGDPISEKAEDVVYDVWLEELGSTTIRFFHPSKEPPAGGERFANAVVVLDADAATDEDRRRILDCLG